MTTVSGTVTDTQGNAVAGASVTVKYKKPIVGYDGGAAVQNVRQFTTDGSGNLSMADLVPGHYEITIAIVANDNTSLTVLQNGTLTVQDTTTQTLEDALDTNLEITPNDVQRAADAADLSQAWAESATPPDPDDAASKSSKTWAGEAADSATTATTQAGNAADSAEEALASETQASLAALAAGAPIVTTLTDPVPANGTVELLKLDAGLQVYEVVAGAWVLRGWLVGPTFDTVQQLLDNTATTLGPDGQIVEAGGFRYEVAASSATDHHVTTAGGVKMYVLAGADGRYSLQSLGLMDGSDATSRFAALMSSGLYLFRFDAGTLKLDGSIISDLPEVDILGTPGASILDSSGGGEINFDAGQAALPSLASDMVQGSNTVLFATAHGLSVGDVFSVWNPADFSFAKLRPTYRDGAMFRVAAVDSATQVKVYGTARDTYAAADINCYKLLGGRARLSGFDIIPPASGIPIKFSCHQDVRVLDVFCPVGVADTAISIDRCFDFRVDVQSTSQGGNAYPVILANSQKGRVYGDGLYSNRHCVSIGGGDADGAVPPRDIQIHNAILTNLDTGIGAGDIHGGSDSIEYHNCIMDVSFNMGGRNSSAYNCTIYGRQLADGNCIFASEVDGGIFRLHNCKLITSGNDVSFGLINFTTSYISRDFILDIRGLTIEHRDPAEAENVRAILMLSVPETNWDASTGSYPAGTPEDRAVFIATDAGTVDGKSYSIGDRIMYSDRVSGGAWVDLPNDKRIDVKIDGMIVNASDLFSVVSWSGARDVSALASTSIQGFDAPSCILVVASNSVNYDMPMKLPEQTIRHQFDTTTSTNSLLSVVLSYKWTYPRRPHVTLGFGPATNGLVNPISAGGFGQTTLYAVMLETQRLRLRLSRIDETNWAEDVSFLAAATVGINDL